MPDPRTLTCAVAALWLTVAAVPAQDPATEQAPGQVERDPALTALIAKIRSAHRGERTGPLDRFRAALRFKSLIADEDSIELDISATFLAPRSLRYRVEEPGKILERGRDDRGVWMRIGDRVESVSGREDQQEVEKVLQQVGLARQLLGFLDPAAILEKLEGATLLDREELPVARKEIRTCDVIRGIAPRFPLFAPPEDGPPEPRCGMKVFIDAETHRLVAVVATPVDAQDRPVGLPEFLLLRDYADGQQIAVPRQLVVFRGAPGEGRPAASVVIRAIDVDPDGVSEATMRRPSR